MEKCLKLVRNTPLSLLIKKETHIRKGNRCVELQHTGEYLLSEHLLQHTMVYTLFSKLPYQYTAKLIAPPSVLGNHNS